MGWGGFGGLTSQGAAFVCAKHLGVNLEEITIAVVTPPPMDKVALKKTSLLLSFRLSFSLSLSLFHTVYLSFFMSTLLSLDLVASCRF